jgi:DNA-binding MarR family transcriptional regulator
MSRASLISQYDPTNCTHTMLRLASRQLTQIYDEALAPAGLTSAQSLLVTRIEEMGGKPGESGPTLQELARRLSVQLSALTHALRPLVREGVVEVLPDSKDRRVKRATLTEKGMAQTQQMLDLWVAINKRIDHLLGPSATEQLRCLAGKVAESGFAERVLAKD